ncbi:BZ3500_MvSof-1268-A1-R1_Chr11-2g03409 [Microbotryum saponariae]|uniref:BZ3500_MvSof-1268-A1-R1_Chr11-2g03409 protein n=1 Tax=Microbotryum saponariae TaxID=289078 RepID=A0A2X0MM11_9BASI|nr:BZ3500_MvSof-1268-A1-R1_Chr11-2g03409 [Microbotryum saponariae]SDA03316.1 BZ3501_MvSof-1269-A2-R1_Chr11g02980 [Microbotryum saponariae]
MFSLISRRTVSRSAVIAPRMSFSTTPMSFDPASQHRAGKPPGLDHLENPSHSEEVIHAERVGKDPLGKDTTGGSASEAWDKVKQVAEDVKDKVIGKK